MIQLYSLTSEAIKEIGRETPPRAASLGGVGVSVVWVLVGGVWLFVLPIAMKGLFYCKSGMTAQPQFEIIG